MAKRRNVGMEGGQWEGLMGGCPGVFVDPGVEALFVRSLCENRGTGGGGYTGGRQPVRGSSNACTVYMPAGARCRACGRKCVLVMMLQGWCSHRLHVTLCARSAAALTQLLCKVLKCCTGGCCTSGEDQTPYQMLQATVYIFAAQHYPYPKLQPPTA